MPSCRTLSASHPQRRPRKSLRQPDVNHCWQRSYLKMRTNFTVNDLSVLDSDFVENVIPQRYLKFSSIRAYPLHAKPFKKHQPHLAQPHTQEYRDRRFLDRFGVHRFARSSIRWPLLDLTAGCAFLFRNIINNCEAINFSLTISLFIQAVATSLEVQKMSEILVLFSIGAIAIIAIVAIVAIVYSPRSADTRDARTGATGRRYPL